MKKSIAIVSQHKDLQPLLTEFDELREHIEQKMEFLRKQRKDLEEQHSERSKEIWSKIETYLVENKLLPSEYSADKFHLCMNDDVVTMHSNDDPELDQHPLGKLMEFFTRIH